MDANRARGLEAGRMVSGPRGDLLVGSVSAWCKGRVAERAGTRGTEGGLEAERASWMRIGPGTRGREGGLRVERGISCGCCECLVRGKGSQEGELDANWAKGLEAGRMVSGPRGDLLVGSVSAWCKGRAAERPVGCELGQRFRGREGGLGAERGIFCGRCECLVRRQCS